MSDSRALTALWPSGFAPVRRAARHRVADRLFRFPPWQGPRAPCRVPWQRAGRRSAPGERGWCPDCAHKARVREPGASRERRRPEHRVASTDAGASHRERPGGRFLLGGRRGLPPGRRATAANQWVIGCSMQARASCPRWAAGRPWSSRAGRPRSQAADGPRATEAHGSGWAVRATLVSHFARREN